MNSPESPFDRLWSAVRVAEKDAEGGVAISGVLRGAAVSSWRLQSSLHLLPGAAEMTVDQDGAGRQGKWFNQLTTPIS